jgi:hypothetical protein
MLFYKYGIIFEGQAQLPTLQDRGERIRIYFSYRIKKQSFINYVEISKKNLKVTYKNKNPVLCPGDAGCFDDAGVMPSCIVNNTLIYTGWSLRKTVPYTHAIGHAVFNESKNKFERVSKGPLIDKQEKIPYLANSGFLFKNKMFFCNGTGWAGNFPKYDIYRAARKREQWIVEEVVLCEKDSACSRPFVNKQGIFFSKKKKNTFYKIYYNNFKKTKKILDKSNYGWDSDMVCYPYLFNDLLFYNGNGYGKTGFGVAILDSD